MPALVGALLVALVLPLPSRAAGPGGGHHLLRKPRAKFRPTRHLEARAPEVGGSFGNRVVRYARRFLGVRYSYGGISPRTGFDCSGLVRYVYGHFGIRLPHSSFADLWQGRRIGRSQLRPGDLVFFDDGGHVGIYIGGNRFLDAPHSGSVVQISTLTWYGATYYGARRLRGR